MSSDKAIMVNGVSKCFEMYARPKDRLLQFFYRGKRQLYKEFWALKDVSLEVARGETFAILGRNGSGKSTLLQIIAGTLSPTAGEVRTNGVLTALLELGSGFNPEFTGRENVYLNGTVLGFTRAQMDDVFDEIVDFADIGDHLDQPVKTYSSGMYVRLAFAVQACVNPQILIVDEALSVGDEKFQRKCFDHLEKLRSQGCSILLVTHSTSTVEKFCQRAALLHKGVLHGIGDAKEIVDQYHALLYTDEKAYLRSLNHKLAGGQQVAQTNESSADDNENGKQSQIGEGQARVLIRDWQVLDANREHCEVFRSNQDVILCFTAEVFSAVKEVQAGILIRTVEGVSAFGTSTLYHDKNLVDPAPGIYEFEFELNLALCEGTYFVTLALAEAISHGDMSYLDRRTDVLILKISNPRIVGHGIANLPVSVKVKSC